MTSNEPIPPAQGKTPRLRSMAYFLSGACCIEFVFIACLVFLWFPPFRKVADSFGPLWSPAVVPVIIFLDYCKRTPMIVPLGCGVLVALAVLPCLFARFLKPRLAIALNFALFVLGAVGNTLILMGILFTLITLT